MIQGVAAKWSFSSLSANKGVNQQVMWFTPFITPTNSKIECFISKLIKSYHFPKCASSISHNEIKK